MSTDPGGDAHDGTLPAPIAGRPYRIVFVCTGNICRSPMAEVVTRALAGAMPVADGGTLADHLIVSSAGTGGWHEGEPMDPRAAAALRRVGYPDHAHEAHQMSKAALAQADLVVALDRGHRNALRRLLGDTDRLVLLRAFDHEADAATDVPDPYYGDDTEFDDCLDMVTRSCRELAEGLASRWNSAGSP